jgi:hypothetical protein
MHSKIVALLLPALAAAYPAPADSPPEGIIIKDTTYSGNGCPQGSVSTSTSEDKTVRTIPAHFPIANYSQQHDKKVVMIASTLLGLPRRYSAFTVS